MNHSRLGLAVERIHFVGIGGIGLSAIARILAAWGYTVSGSDLRASKITRDLQAIGIRTFEGHAQMQVGDADLVVISSAVPETNPEVQAAQARGIPVLKRHTLLGRMMAGSYGIAVAGTHGKTTTTAMISVMLAKSGLDPTFIVGGIVSDLGTNAGAGSGAYFVVEADEYDRTFLGLNPRIAVVTNVEMDHPDCYRDLEDMRTTFGVYLDQVAEDGAIIACADSPELIRVLRERCRPMPAVVTYGLSPQSDLTLEGIQANARGGMDWRVRKGQRVWGEFSLGLSGMHNALNATAALAVVDMIGIDRVSAATTLADFRGVLRRFEVKGEWRGVTIIDDYAHHPTEIRATLAAARLRYSGRRIWAVWQPHTYSRTEALFQDFTSCFGDADQVIVLDIYAARARERASLGAIDLVRAMQHSQARYVGSIDDVVGMLEQQLGAGDVLLTLGAGDGYLVGERLMNHG
jgi:UDP-N-acetylmuramate--alanine ligase